MVGSTTQEMLRRPERQEMSPADAVEKRKFLVKERKEGSGRAGVQEGGAEWIEREVPQAGGCAQELRFPSRVTGGLRSSAGEPGDDLTAACSCGARLEMQRSGGNYHSCPGER